MLVTGGPTAFPARIRLQILQVCAVFFRPPKKSSPTCRGDLLIISLGGFSLPRKLILGSIKSVRGSPQGLAKKSSPTCRGDLLIISLGGFSLPRKLILGSIKSVRGSPQGLAKKSSPTCRGDLLIISLGGFSLPRKLILGSIKSGGLLCFHSLPGLICLLRLLCLLRFLSIICSFVCCDCSAYVFNLCLLCLL